MRPDADVIPVRRFASSLLSVLLRLAAGTLALLAGARTSGQPAQSKEYELKAAFLYNFTKFVTWPEERFADPHSPIIIGVFGKSPFSPELAAAIAARKTDGRPVLLRNVSTPATAAEVHVLFVPAWEERAAEAVLEPERKAGVLYVGETEAFREHGGTITFDLDRDKLRFVINMNAADRAGLKISAQLLKLAKRVERN